MAFYDQRIAEIKNKGFNQRSFLTVLINCSLCLVSFNKSNQGIESNKDVLAKLGFFSLHDILARVYQRFLDMQGMVWSKPLYRRVETLPFIPSKNEIDALIARMNYCIAALLQLLKESAMRPGEVWNLRWIDTRALSTLDSLSLLGFTKNSTQIKNALEWFIDRQQENDPWKLAIVKGENRNILALWLTLAICRIFKRYYL